MSIKISLIGAGSAVFSLALIRDLCLTTNLQDSLICFMDIDQTRLDTAHELCRRYAQELGVSLRFQKTLDRREALQDADFVVNTALAAGHQRLEEGWAVAAQHGYRFGGSLHIMHDEAFWINYYQFRLFESIIEDILTICPKAYHLLVANPVFAAVTHLGRKYPEARLVGLCHGFSMVYHIAKVLGLDREHLSFEIPGVNHFVWLTKLYHNGQDALPLLEKWVRDQAQTYWESAAPSDGLGPKACDLYRRFGAFPIGDTGTVGGGSWGEEYHRDDETERHWHEDPDRWWTKHINWTRQVVLDMQALAANPAAKLTDTIKPEFSGEVMVPMIEALACDTSRVLIGNVPNTRDFVPGIPRHIGVEIPLLVSKHGLQGVATDGLPPELTARVLRDYVAPVETEIAAYTQGSKRLLLEMIMMDGQTRSYSQAVAMLDAILALPYHEDMRAHYR